MDVFHYLRVSKGETRRIHDNGSNFQRALARLHRPSLFIALQISVSGLSHKDSRLLGEGLVKHLRCHFNHSTATRVWITEEAMSKSLFTSTIAFHHTTLKMNLGRRTIPPTKCGSLNGKAQTKVWCKVKWMVEGDGGRERETWSHMCHLLVQCLRSTSESGSSGSADAWNGVQADDTAVTYILHKYLHPKKCRTGHRTSLHTIRLPIHTYLCS